MTESEPNNRATFYSFGPSNFHWQNKGTGNVTCIFPTVGKPSILLSNIEGPYDIEGSCRYENIDEGEGSIILWREQNVAYALSFEDTAGCWTVWECLTEISLTKDLPWHSLHMTPWQRELWEHRVHKESIEKFSNKDTKRDMRCPLTRPRELIFCSNMVKSSSPIEPLFHDWFISHVISFLDLPSIVKLDTALSCFSLRKRWLEGLSSVNCPSGVDNFDMHAKESVQWLISRRLKISRLSVTPWYMFTHGGSAGLYNGNGRFEGGYLFDGCKDSNFGDSLQHLEIANCGVKEGCYFYETPFENMLPFNFTYDGGLIPLSACCKALRSVSLEFGENTTYFDDADYVPLFTGCHQLTKLKLKHTELLSDAVLQVLARDCHQLEDIEIELGCPEGGPFVSHSAFADLVTQLPLLRRLVLEFYYGPNGTSKAMLASLVQCPLLEELFLSDMEEITDQDMRGLIQRCNKLTKLGFHKSSGLTTSHFAIIGSSTSITSLTFNVCEGSKGRYRYGFIEPPTDGCTDNAFTALSSDGRLQLKEITIGLLEDDGWSDGIVAEITDAGVRTLATRFVASLEGVTLKYCREVTDDGLAALAICSHLESVTLKYCSEITDDGLAALANCLHLRSIAVIRCQLVSGAFIEPLTESCRGLEKIDCSGLTVSFRAIADRCPLLRDVTLSGATDKKVTRLVRGCPLLTHVRLYGKKLTDVSLAAIAAGLPHLEVLSISDDAKVTESGLYNLLEKCLRITCLDAGAVNYQSSGGNLIPNGIKITDPALRRMILQRRILVAGVFNDHNLAYDLVKKRQEE